MSLVKDLIDLQIGIGKRNVIRRREIIVKKLIVSPCRDFKNSSEILNRGSNIFTFMHAGRIFLQQSLQENKKVLCSCAYPSWTPTAKKQQKQQQLFSFPCNFKCKDLVIWSPDSALSTERLLLDRARHTSSILYLEDSRYLVRRCCLSGKLEDKIFLSNILKFNEMTTESESDIITLKSTRTKDTSEGGDVVFTLAVFTSPPLKFLAMFEVKTSIFGRRIQDVGVSQGLIFIRYSNNKVSMYSLNAVLDKCIVTKVEDMDELTSSRIGVKPFNLPLNAEITEKPPALFEVDSYQGELTIGANPWHYITKTSETELEIRSLMNKTLVTSVKYSTHFAGMEVEHLFFHPDDTRKVIHVCNNKLSVFHILENGFEPHLVHTEKMPQFNRFLARETSVTRSGRTVKKSLAAQEAIASQILDDENTLTHDLTISLDADTNIFAIFAVAAEKPEQLKMMHITLYDNTTGKLLRKIPIDTSLSCSLFNVTCNLTLEGVNIFAEVRDKSFMHGRLLSLVEIFS